MALHIRGSRVVKGWQLYFLITASVLIISGCSGSGTSSSAQTTIYKRVDVTSTHDGESNFIVWAKENITAQSEDLVANIIGIGTVVEAASLEGGKNYFFDVMADGNWTISISGVNVDAQTYSGQGDGITPNFHVKG